MNVKPLVTIAIVWCAAAPLRADYVARSELEVLRFASLWPDTQPKQTPLPAVVRVIAVDRDGLSLGSGTLVDANDANGLIITNWHVVRDSVGQVEVVFPDGFHSPARIVRTDREWDLAALLIWKPLGVKPVPITTVAPRPGEPLTIAGYGSGNYKMQTGACTQYLAPAPGRPLEIVELSAAARHGDSGGPILNSRGELAGVLFGEGGGRTDGSYGGRVNQFLQLAAKDLRGLPASADPRGGTSNIAKNSNSLGNTGTHRQPGAIAQLEGDTRGSSAETPPWESAPATSLADRSAAGPLASANRSGRPLPLSTEATVQPSASPAILPRAIRFVWADEVKTFLAAFGVAAILLNLMRRMAGSN